MLRKKYLLFLISVIGLLSFKSTENINTITWLSWETAYQKALEEDKILLLEVVTTVCPYCIKMENETYVDPKIVQLVNQNFIPCKINPKSDKEIYQFNNQSLNGTQLVNALSQNSQNSELGKIVFPTTIFYLPNIKQSFVEPGYQPPDVFVYMLYNCIKYKDKINKKKK